MSLEISFILSGIIFLVVFIVWIMYVSGHKKTARAIKLAVERGKKSKKTKVKFLEEANEKGVPITPEQYVLSWGLAIIASVGFAFLLANPLIIPIVLGTFWIGLRIYVSQKERKIREKAKEQLGPTLQNLGSIYRTQKNWLRSLDVVIPMLEEPLRSEFIRVKNAHQTGMPIGEAFREMMERLKVPEMQLFVTMAEISEQVGEAVAEGVMVSGSYFQTMRLAAAEVANAMVSALSENKMLVYGFVGVIFYFRLFQEEIFAGFMNSVIGKVLLAVYISIAILALMRSYYVIRKEI